jgi:hypothetical protein
MKVGLGEGGEAPTATTHQMSECNNPSEHCLNLEHYKNLKSHKASKNIELCYAGEQVGVRERTLILPHSGNCCLIFINAFELTILRDTNLSTTIDGPILGGGEWCASHHGHFTLSKIGLCIHRNIP